MSNVVSESSKQIEKVSAYISTFICEVSVIEIVDASSILGVLGVHTGFLILED